MKNTELMILTGPGYGLVIPPEAEALKSELLAASATVVAVTSNNESDSARVHIGKLADMRIAVEKSRKMVKEPVLELGSRIDAAAKNFCGAVADEETRLKGLVTSYAAKVERERQEAIRKQQDAERERIRLELLEETRRKAAEAEANRIAEEKRKAEEAAEAALWDAADQATKKATAEEAAKLAELEEANRKQIALDALTANTAAEEVSAKVLEAALAAKTAKGPEGVSWNYDYQVSDINQLFRVHPELCDLTVKRAAVLAEIREQAKDGGEPVIPGLTIIRTAKVR